MLLSLLEVKLIGSLGAASGSPILFALGLHFANKASYTFAVDL